MAKDFTNSAATFDTEKIVMNYYVDGEGYYPAGIKIKLNPTNPDIQITQALTTGWAKLGTAQPEPYTDVQIFLALKVILGTSWKNKVKELYNNITEVNLPD